MAPQGLGLKENQVLMDLPKCGTQAVVEFGEVSEEGQISISFQWEPKPGVTSDMVEAEINEIVNAALAAEIEEEEFKAGLNRGDVPCSMDLTPK